MWRQHDCVPVSALCQARAQAEAQLSPLKTTLLPRYPLGGMGSTRQYNTDDLFE